METKKNRRLAIIIAAAVVGALILQCAVYLLLLLGMGIANGAIVLHPEPGTDVYNEAMVLSRLEKEYQETFDVLQKEIVSSSEVAYRLKSRQTGMEFSAWSCRSAKGSDLFYDDQTAYIADNYRQLQFYECFCTYLTQAGYQYGADCENPQQPIFFITISDEIMGDAARDLGYFYQSIQSVYDMDRYYVNAPKVYFRYRMLNGEEYVSRGYDFGQYGFKRIPGLVRFDGSEQFWEYAMEELLLRAQEEFTIS